MTAIAGATLGVNVLPNNVFGAGTTVLNAPKAKCKNVILLYMKGAMSHIETLDPKTDSDVKGSSSPIDTVVNGIQLSNFLPKLAKHTGKMAIIRSMNTETGAHAQASYLMHTAHALSPGTNHPHIGPWAQHFLGKRPGAMPDSVVIGGGNPGPGFFEPDHSPFPVGNPGQGIKHLLPKVEQDEFRKRVALASAFSSTFQKQFPHPKVKSYSTFYEQTIEFLNGDAVKAFDITKEPAKAKSLYGNSTFGKGCLLARRLIENDVRYIEVKMPQGWDMHFGLERLEDNTAILDKAMSALLQDLSQRGLLKETMVVLATEFGRSPKINKSGGRDHHPRVFSTVLAGAGVKNGMVHGQSDAKGNDSTRDRVTVQDFHATIAKALGLPLDKRIHGSGGRPFFVADRGTPVDAVLA